MSPRRRRLLAWLLGGGVLMAVFVLLAMAWLGTTSSGLTWVLDRASTATEGRLRAIAAPGSSARNFALQDLQWRGEGWSLHIDHVDGQLAWSGLLRRTLQVHRLRIGEITLLRDQSAAPADAAAFTEVPAWTLPDLSLPFRLELDQVSIARVVEADQVLAEAIELRAQWAPDGDIRIERLDLRRAAQRWQLRGELPGRIEIEIAATAPEAPSMPRLLGVLEADSGALSLQMQREGGGRVRARLDHAAAWTLVAELDAADARAFDLAAPDGSRVRVEAAGGASAGELEAELHADGWPVHQLQAAWSRTDSGWLIDRFGMQGEGASSISGQGQWPDLASVPRKFTAEFTAWPLWPPDAQSPRFSGSGRIDGPLGALDLRFDGSLLGAEVEPDVLVELRLGSASAVLQRLQLDSHGASLVLQGEADWGEQLAFTGTLLAERFDPAWLSAALQGEIGGSAALGLRQQDERWNLQLEAIDMSGLWNRQTFALTGAGSWSTDAPAQGAVELRLGSGLARLQATATGVQAEFSRLQLADLYPAARGRIDGTLAVDLPFAAERLRADLRVGNPGWNEVGARSLALKGALGNPARSMIARLDGLKVGEQQLDTVVDLRGSRADFQLAVQASGEAWQADLNLQAAVTDEAVEVALQQLQFDGGEAGSWTLSAPARLSGNQQHWQLTPLCLDGKLDAGGDKAEGRLCLQREQRAGSALLLSLAPLDITHVARLWADPQLWRWQGQIAAELQLVPGLDGWTLGPSELRLQRGQVQYADAESERPVLQWESIRLHSESAGAAHRLVLLADLGEDGEVRGGWQLAELSLAGLPRAEGAIEVDVRHLAALQLLMPDLVDADGQLRGRIDSRLVDGRLEWDGGLELSGLRGQIPAAGISLLDSSLSLREQEGRWELQGELFTGGGPLRVEGSWLADGSGQWRLAGEQVWISDTRLLKLIASPDLLVRLQDGALHVSGKVVVPEARFDIERLEAGESVSADVVVLDPVEPPGRRGPALHADIEVVLGDRAELRGFGFDGGLKGSLRVRERPGRPASGRGNLELRGRYRAYGQDLTLQRGRLLFSGGALDNPGIDIRAAREVDEVTVGIQVSGPARRPRLRVWSEPALDQAEAISYLVLGQPLRSAGSADGRQLGEAAAAMGGNLLAARLGGRLGFDTFGIADSGALGGAAFTVGKYLSPSLYLSYGVGLFEPGQVVTLRYLLSERADVQVESARESRVGVNYRWETD